MERKFAVTRCVGNKESVLNTFENKNDALAYGAEVSKTNTEGVIVCVLAMFNEKGRMNNQNVVVFEVWKPKHDM